MNLIVTDHQFEYLSDHTMARFVLGVHILLFHNLVHIKLCVSASTTAIQCKQSVDLCHPGNLFIKHARMSYSSVIYLERKSQRHFSQIANEITISE